MKMLFQAFTTLCTIAASISIGLSAPEPKTSNVLASLCPEFFNYESTEEPGLWTGKLSVRSDEDLHGVWIRLFFERNVKEVSAEGFEAKFNDDDTKEVLLKNRKQLLKASSPITLKFTVSYEGSQLPKLIEYRLNARTLCPDPKTLRTDFFQGDAAPSNFFATLQSNCHLDIPKPNYECGITNPSQQYPWRATISLGHSGPSTKPACEAIIISPLYLITPAHCVTFQNDGKAVPSEFLSVQLGNGNQVKVTKRSMKVEKLGKTKTRLNWLGNEIDKNGALGNNVVGAEALKICREECVLKNQLLKDVLEEDTYCVSYISENKNCVGSSGNGFISTENGRSTLRGIVTLGLLLQNEKECQKNSTIVVADIGKHIKWIQRIIYRL
ncbi:hypothetical protein JTB14_031167 [Gonioctena quinquepunctata]|nr:hypothetical protein JTB14_031167 [Gonioctena quinquepunctata]